MTVKELSQFCGCTERNIQHWVKKACNDTANEQLAKKLQKTVSSAGHGKSATFNIDEVELILKNSTLPPLVVSALIQNARGDNTSNSVAQNNDCLTRAFEHMTRAFEYISKTQAMQEERLSKLEHHFEERKALLPAPGIKPRDHINMLARSYAKTTETSIKEAYGELYRQFAYRTNSNPRICAQNRGMAILDYIETEGQIEVLESVAMEIFA